MHASIVVIFTILQLHSCVAKPLDSRILDTLSSQRCLPGTDHCDDSLTKLDFPGTTNTDIPSDSSGPMLMAKRGETAAQDPAAAAGSSGSNTGAQAPASQDEVPVSGGPGVAAQPASQDELPASDGPAAAAQPPSGLSGGGSTPASGKSGKMGGKPSSHGHGGGLGNSKDENAPGKHSGGGHRGHSGSNGENHGQDSGPKGSQGQKHSKGGHSSKQGGGGGQGSASKGGATPGQGMEGPGPDEGVSTKIGTVASEGSDEAHKDA